MLVATFAALTLAAVTPAAPVVMPGGASGVGFDDIFFSPALGKVLIPSAKTGNLNLIDPKTQSVETISGFSTEPMAGGHGAGSTSADFGAGFVFASDRGHRQLVVVDPSTRQIVARQDLAAGPDYVRFVEPSGEVWVTEPRNRAIEVFKLEKSPKVALTHVADIKVDDGPESLAVDPPRGRAYAHSWKDTTYVIDLAKHAVVAQWKNGCTGARGIALDPQRALLFVGCDEGKATALDVAHDGAKRGEAKSGKGVDIIAYAPALHRLYVPGGDEATLTVMSVGDKGELQALQTLPTAEDAHCAAVDDRGNAYVCDPKKGRMLVFHDAP
ncbi:MAG: hypothetical protein JST54_07345 [Deltaproteobacteria bacterium]|nr:hypothetical protein [Deltaproteobacteria bacterium]